MKATIFWRSDKEWSLTDKNGKLHTGRTFQAFCEDGVPRRFTSEIQDFDVVKGAMRFDPENFVDITLVPKIGDNGITWQDKTPLDGVEE